jgi:hypothetical protein
MNDEPIIFLLYVDDLFLTGEENLNIVLVSDVTHGLQQEQSPTPISLMSRFFYRGMIKWKKT